MQQSKRPASAKTSKTSSANGVVRIIGGQYRSRKLRFSASQGLRPTLDRIRETLFNWLSHDIVGANCLDLFAGSGALGFEACSRGAASVTMVEKTPSVVRDLRSNCQLLGLSTVNVMQMDAFAFLQHNQEKFDLVFLDPPFTQGLLSKVFPLLEPHLNPQALVYIEQEKSKSPFQPPLPWQAIKHKQSGSFSYALYCGESISNE